MADEQRLVGGQMPGKEATQPEGDILSKQITRALEVLSEIDERLTQFNARLHGHRGERENSSIGGSQNTQGEAPMPADFHGRNRQLLAYLNERADSIRATVCDLERFA